MVARVGLAMRTSRQPPGKEDQEGERQATQEMVGVERVGQKVERKGTGEKDIGEHIEAVCYRPASIYRMRVLSKLCCLLTV